MAKYFITKLQADGRTHRIVAVRDKREVARTDCKSFGKNATARSAEDIAGFEKHGVLDLNPQHLHGYVPAEQVGTSTGSTGRTHAVEPGTVAAATGEPAKASLMDTAKAILAKPAGKRTLGGKAKAAPKRVETTAEVLVAARKALAEFAAAEGANKVGIVRAISVWNSLALQRRDLFALFGEATAPEICRNIAAATISTQFQVARSRYQAAVATPAPAPAAA